MNLENQLLTSLKMFGSGRNAEEEVEKFHCILLPAVVQATSPPPGPNSAKGPRGEGGFGQPGQATCETTWTMPEPPYPMEPNGSSQPEPENIDFDRVS